MIKIIRCDKNEVAIMLDKEHVYYLKPVTAEDRVIVALVERIKELEAIQNKVNVLPTIEQFEEWYDKKCDDLSRNSTRTIALKAWWASTKILRRER